MHNMVLCPFSIKISLRCKCTPSMRADLVDSSAPSNQSRSQSLSEDLAEIMNAFPTVLLIEPHRAFLKARSRFRGSFSKIQSAS